jgi:protein-S-isoprenylcysteine O-methyltransferase Ste14
MPPESRDRPGVIAPPPLIYAAFFGLGLLVRRWLRIDIPYAWPIGIALAAASVTIVIAGFVAMHRAGTNVDPYQPTTAIVTRGPYRWSRNPLYIGLTLGYLSAALIVDVAAAIILLPAALVVMHYGVIRREERYLESKFGETYRAYRERVRRWI